MPTDAAMAAVFEHGRAVEFYCMCARLPRALDKMLGSAAKVFGQVIGVRPKEKEGWNTPMTEHMRDKLKQPS